MLLVGGGAPVLARRGWAGKKSRLFEHPTRFSLLVHNVQVIEVLPCQNGVSGACQILVSRGVPRCPKIEK